MKYLSEFFDSDLLSDVTFIATDRSGNEKRIRAHKLALASMSPVFKCMFCGELKEGAVVPITDVSAECFTEFLQLFYKSADVKLTEENIVEVMQLADKYDVKEFTEHIEPFLKQIVSDKNACLFYELALSLPLWHQKADEYLAIINNNAAKVFESSSFLDLNESTLTSILQSDRLSSDEITVLNAVIAWVNNSLISKSLSTSTENFNAEAKDIIKHIRFPTMKLAEFLNVIKSHPNLLEFDVYIDIISFLSLQAPLTAAKHFKIIPRRNPAVALAGVSVSGKQLFGAFGVSDRQVLTAKRSNIFNLSS